MKFSKCSENVCRANRTYRTMLYIKINWNGTIIIWFIAPSKPKSHRAHKIIMTNNSVLFGWQMQIGDDGGRWPWPHTICIHYAVCTSLNKTSNPVESSECAETTPSHPLPPLPLLLTQHTPLQRWIDVAQPILQPHVIVVQMNILISIIMCITERIHFYIRFVYVNMASVFVQCFVCVCVWLWIDATN